MDGRRLSSSALEPKAPEWDEVADYMNVRSERLYYVLHKAKGTQKGSVLLAGPFASMRRYVYTPWVRWARYLAAAGYEVLRFDYRGVGESSGNFSHLSLSDWVYDVRCCAELLRHRGSNVPLLLHGLHLGALLSCRVFREGEGDALLLWSAPASGMDMLEHALKMHRAARFRLLRHGSAPPAEDHVALLEAGQQTEVEGYRWSPELWREAGNYTGAKELTTLKHDKPWLEAVLDNSAGPLLLSLHAAPERDVGLPLNPNLSGLFKHALRQVDQLLGARGVSHAAGASC